MPTSARRTNNYSYQATYNGDNNFATSTGDLQPFTPHQPSSFTSQIAANTAIYTLSLHDALPILGTQVHDTATVTSGNNSFVIGGTVSYQRFTGLDCQTANKIGIGRAHV